MQNLNKELEHCLTVRFLVSGTGAWTAKLLGLASSGIGDHQGSVVLNELVLEDSLTVLIDVLLVVSDEAASDSLTDGIDLGDSTTTRDLDFDVDLGESLFADDEKWLFEFKS